MSTFREGYLEGRSERSSDLNRLVTGHYDLILLASSWDARCICVTQCTSVNADRSAAIMFSTRDSMGLRDKHDPAIVAFSKGVAKNFRELHGDSAKIEGLWRQLYGLVDTAQKEVGRPLHVLFDLSTCPRYLAGGIVGLCLRTGLVGTLTLSYSEAVYPPHSAGAELPFTGSRWRTIAMPGLQGTYDPRRKRFYLVSVGFEGSKTLRAVSHADPDRIAVLLPYPGFNDDYSGRSKEANRELLAAAATEPHSVIEAAAGDVIAAWRSLSETPQERPETENTFYLCCGTKPHSLALTLRAMALGYPTVLYNVSEHAVLPIESSGHFWRYDIRNVAVAG